MEVDKPTQARLYSLKIWLTSVLISPGLSLLTILRHAKNLHDIRDILMLFLGIPGVLVFVAACSLPSALGFYLGCLYLLKSRITPVLRKLLLSIIGILLTWMPVFVLGDFKFIWDWDSMAILLSYALVIVAGIWIYNPEATSRGASRNGQTAITKF